MTTKLLVCTDLDRTLIPNGPQPESPGARQRFATLVARPEVSLAYVSGRHRALVEKAIANYRLPVPDFVIGDVGTTIYRLDAKQQWQRDDAWEEEIGRDWGGLAHAELKALLAGLPDLRPQERTKQNTHKLSYYVPLHSDRHRLAASIEQRLAAAGAKASQIWSVDEPQGVGLLDVLPARASKLHAIQALMRMQGFNADTTVFCGDSGNDLEVLVSELPAVLVANAQREVRELALRLAGEGGHADRLYVAGGGFMDMNGNYAAGMLEGIAHYRPDTVEWMGFDTRER